MNLRKRKLDQKAEPPSSKRTPLVEAAETDKAAAVEPAAVSWQIEQFLSDEGWKEALKDEFEKDYFKQMNKTLSASYAKNLARPPKEKVFNAFNSTKLGDIKVVILGQDPYHDENQVSQFTPPKHTPTKYGNWTFEGRRSVLQRRERDRFAQIAQEHLSRAQRRHSGL